MVPEKLIEEQCFFIIGLPGSHLSPSLERSVLAYTTMNKYLSSFIEHAIQDNDYLVKDKFLMEKLLQNELQAPVDKCKSVYLV